MSENSKQISWAEFANGDADIWRRFLEVQIPKLYCLFLQRWCNRSLAEELVQKTVFDAVKGLKTYDGSKGNPEEWIFGIARNNIRLEIRKRAAGPSINGDLSTYLDAIDTKPLPDEILEKEETAQIVRKALEKLESKEQAVLKAKYIENLSARQISEKINITEKAVHSLLYRARNSLRVELKRIAALNRTEQKL